MLPHVFDCSQHINQPGGGVSCKATVDWSLIEEKFLKGIHLGSGMTENWQSFGPEGFQEPSKMIDLFCYMQFRWLKFKIGFLVKHYILQHFGNERKRDARTQQDFDIRDDVHNQVLAEMLSRWRLHHHDTTRSRLTRYQKRSEDRSNDLYGFIKKTVVPFPRIGWFETIRDDTTLDTFWDYLKPFPRKLIAEGMGVLKMTITHKDLKQ